MKHVQKLVLVPIERWEKIGDKIPVKEVSVKTVPQMNTHHTKKKKHQSSQIKRVKIQQGLGKTPTLKQSRMFHFLAQEPRKKASKLFQFLMKYNIFSLNHNGEIVQNGKTIHDSNILELITHAVQNDSSSPKGMKYFYRTLKKKNFPEKFIVNKIGRKIMNVSLIDDTLPWRPPGHLHKR